MSHQQHLFVLKDERAHSDEFPVYLVLHPLTFAGPCAVGLYHLLCWMYR
jgi:hypothetical protein